MAFMCSCNFEPGKSLDVDHFLNIAQVFITSFVGRWIKCECLLIFLYIKRKTG